MKKYLLFMPFVLIQSFLMAQATGTEGVIVFEEKINLHRRIQDEQAKAMIPEYRTNKMLLYFRGDESIYKPDVEEEDEEASLNGGGGRMVFRRPMTEIYRNFAAEKRVEERDFMGKKYLIEDTLRNMSWKLGTETKKILGYECMNATLNDTARRQKVTAWFTDKVTLPSGPSNFGMLPGMILEVDVNSGEMVTTAAKIDFKKVKDNDIKAPSKGEKITEKEFRAKVEEWMKQNGGRGGNNIRIMRN